MTKKYINQFHNLFSELKNAVAIFNGAYPDYVANDAVSIEEIGENGIGSKNDSARFKGEQVSLDETTETRLKFLINGLDKLFFTRPKINSVDDILMRNTLFDSIFEEIEGNLYQYPKERNVYLNQILKPFTFISPYLLEDLFDEIGIHHYDYPYDHNSIHFEKEYVIIYYKSVQTKIFPFIKHHRCFEGTDVNSYKGLKSIEQYIMLCYHLYVEFFKRLESLCKAFSVDLIVFQVENKLFPRVWKANSCMTFESSRMDLAETEIKPDATKEVSSYNSPVNFKGDEIKKLVIKGLVFYFDEGNREELNDLFDGESIKDKLLFKGSAGQLVEFFRRLKYHEGIFCRSDTALNLWIRNNFMFTAPATGDYTEFNEGTTSDYLSGKNNLASKNRIMAVEFPFKSKQTLEKDNKR